MTSVRLILLLALILFCLTLAWATGQKSILDGGAVLLAEPWGVMTLVDLYLGFGLIGAWIIALERHPRAAAWVVALFLLGNIVALIYFLNRTRGAKGKTWREVFLPAPGTP